MLPCNELLSVCVLIKVNHGIDLCTGLELCLSLRCLQNLGVFQVVPAGSRGGMSWVYRGLSCSSKLTVRSDAIVSRRTCYQVQHTDHVMPVASWSRAVRGGRRAGTGDGAGCRMALVNRMLNVFCCDMYVCGLSHELAVLRCFVMNLL